MSYDIEIASHARPDISMIATWASEQGLVFEDGYIRRNSGHLFSVDGPFAAEADDLHEEAAAACLAPGWMLTLSVPASAPKLAITRAKALARAIASALDGSAVDLQTDARIWPRGTPKRVAARRREERVDVVQLAWFLSIDRWPAAPATLVRMLRTFAPEALPRRYGRFEPPEHRFDPAAPDEFIAYARTEEGEDAFWLSSRPSFGGSWSMSDPHQGQARIVRIAVEFDGSVLADDPRWREAVVQLFTTAAVELGAFFGAAQVDAGWIASANNRLWSTAGARHTAEYILRRREWRGLPPLPMWLSWFGPPYRDLVAPALGARAETHVDGITLRLGDLPQPPAKLGDWPVPEDLTYRGPRDAAVIPDLATPQP